MSSKELPALKITHDDIISHREKWRGVALSQSMIDKSRVREGIANVYRLAKMPPPSHIFWLSSPPSGALAAALLTKKTGRSFEPNVRYFYESLHKNLKKVIEHRHDKTQWLEAESKLNHCIFNSYGQAVQELRRALQIQLTIGSAARAGAHEGIGISREEGSLDAVLNQLVIELDVQLPPFLSDAIKPLKSEAWQLNQILSSALAASWNCHCGSMDTELPFFELASLGGLKLPNLHGFITLAQSCGWWWPMREYCIVTARPQVFKTDESGHLHSTNGPALQYIDGWGVHAWHGRIVPPRFLTFARNMNSQDIIAEPNAELRRVMIDMFGIDAFMLSGAHKIQEDECGELWWKELPGDESLVMVRVTNSTPEPDGHIKKYFLRVPPNITSAREAVAWTFGMTADEYHPRKET